MAVYSPKIVEFLYRLGIENGLQIELALKSLVMLLDSHSGNLAGVVIVPIYGYRDTGTGDQVDERGTPALHSM